MSGNRQAAIEKNLTLRAGVIRAVRRFFVERDYLEVETPIRIPAPAPEVHVDAPESGDWYLQPSPELCMKRLLAAGYSRIFQICRCFREKERGRRHLPELTMLEWYTAGHTYWDMMDQCEDLIRFAAVRTGVGDTLTYQGRRIDLRAPWDRVTVSGAFADYASLSIEDALEKDRFDEIMAEEIEPHLGRPKPVFLYDYPVSRGALARTKPTDRFVAERFELYISGLELCNAFTELTDADEQRARFENERSERRLRGRKVYPMPEMFIESLASMPPASGNALGIDRLVMLFADTADIDDVVAFTPEEL